MNKPQPPTFGFPIQAPALDPVSGLWRCTRAGMALCSPGVVAGTLQHPLSMGTDTASRCLPLVGKFREGRGAPREPWQGQHSQQHPQHLATPNREPPPGMLCSPASRKQTCRARKGSCTAPLGGLLYLNSAPPVVSYSQVVFSVRADTGFEMNEGSKGCTTVYGLQFFGLSIAGHLPFGWRRLGSTTVSAGRLGLAGGQRKKPVCPLQ